MPIAPGPQPGFQMVSGAGPGACGKQRGPALAVPTDNAFSLQKHWPPGTQCVTKHDHTKPKPRELAFRKGDMVTIIEAVEVRPVGAQVHAAVLRGHGQNGTPVSSSQLPEPVPSLLEGSSPPSLAVRSSCPQGKGWYRARHNETGQEGLLAASALRERGAIRADPKLSLMP